MPLGHPQGACGARTTTVEQWLRTKSRFDGIKWNTGHRCPPTLIPQWSHSGDHVMNTKKTTIYAGVLAASISATLLAFGCRTGSVKTDIPGGREGSHRLPSDPSEPVPEPIRKSPPPDGPLTERTGERSDATTPTPHSPSATSAQSLSNNNKDTMKLTSSGIAVAAMTVAAAVPSSAQSPIQPNLKIEKIVSVRTIETNERVKLELVVTVNNPGDASVRLHDGKVNVVLNPLDSQGVIQEGRQMELGSAKIPKANVTNPGDVDTGRGERFIKKRSPATWSFTLDLPESLPEAYGREITVAQFRYLKDAQNIINDGFQRYSIVLYSDRNNGGVDAQGYADGAWAGRATTFTTSFNPEDRNPSGSRLGTLIK